MLFRRFVMVLLLFLFLLWILKVKLGVGVVMGFFCYCNGFCFFILIIVVVVEVVIMGFDFFIFCIKDLIIVWIFFNMDICLDIVLVLRIWGFVRKLELVFCFWGVMKDSGIVVFLFFDFWYFCFFGFMVFF